MLTSLAILFVDGLCGCGRGWEMLLPSCPPTVTLHPPLAHILGCFAVRVVWVVYPSNDLGLSGPTLSQLISSSQARLISIGVFLVLSIRSLLTFLCLRNLLNFLRGGFHCSMRVLASTHYVSEASRHGLRRNISRQISFEVTLVFFQRGRLPYLQRRVDHALIETRRLLRASSWRRTRGS